MKSWLSQSKNGKLQANLTYGYCCEHPKQNTRQGDLKPKVAHYDQVCIISEIQG